jgi:hypothetical protein
MRALEFDAYPCTLHFNLPACRDASRLPKLTINLENVGRTFLSASGNHKSKYYKQEPKKHKILL